MTVIVHTARNGVRFEVRVQPRAARSEVVGEHDGALRVRLAAPPVDGAANEALIELLADLLRIAKRDVRIVAGATSRRKVVELAGVTREQLHELLPQPRETRLP